MVLQTVLVASMGHLFVCSQSRSTRSFIHCQHCEAYFIYESLYDLSVWYVLLYRQRYIEEELAKRRGASVQKAEQATNENELFMTPEHLRVSDCVLVLGRLSVLLGRLMDVLKF